MPFPSRILPEQRQLRRPHLRIHHAAIAGLSLQAPQRLKCGGFARPATADNAVEIRAQVDRLTVQKPAAEADAQHMRDRWRDLLLDAHSSIGVLEGYA